MNFSTLDLNLLRVLDALLHERSTVKAGERVGLSQPAVSNALTRLRLALGDPLLVRHGQRLVPTDYALGVELPLRRLLDDLEAMLSGPSSFDPASASNAFKICGSDFFAEMLMPDLAEAVVRCAPNMKIQLIDLVPDNYVATLERYEADLALIPKADYPQWVDGQPVFRSDFVIIARKGHPGLAAEGVAEGGQVPLDLFCDLGHVLFSPEGNLKAMGDAALARIGRERRVVMTLPVFGGVCQAVAGSDLVALLPLQLALKMAPKTGLAIYRPPMPVATVQMWMIWHRRSTANPAHRWLRDLVAGLLGPLDGMVMPPAS